MNSFTEAALTIASIVGGISMVAIIISKNANTTGVIQAAASGYGNMLATAMSPVTGATVGANNAYPSIASGAGFGLPVTNYGSPQL